MSDLINGLDDGNMEEMDTSSAREQVRSTGAGDDSRDEARLKISRAQISQPATNAPAGNSVPNNSDLQKVIEILTGLATDPFSLINHVEKADRKDTSSSDERSGAQGPKSK